MPAQDRKRPSTTETGTAKKSRLQDVVDAIFYIGQKVEQHIAEKMYPKKYLPKDYLPQQMIKDAREKEMKNLRDLVVYKRVKRTEAAKAGKRIIGTRWEEKLRRNAKGEVEARSRLVVQVCCCCKVPTFLPKIKRPPTGRAAQRWLRS